MDIPDMQIIDGKFYTKPAEPVEIPRATVEEWLVQAQVEKTNAQTAKEQAANSRTSTIAQLDSTVDHWDEEMNAVDVNIATIQGWLDQVPE